MVRQLAGVGRDYQRDVVSGPTVTVDAKALRKALRDIGDKGLKRQLAKANKDAAQVVVDEALPHVPVLSGRLRRAVRALGSQTSGRAVAGGGSVPYAAAIHWGRKKGGVIQGRPFLSDAAARAEAKAADVYLEAVDDLLDEIRKR